MGISSKNYFKVMKIISFFNSDYNFSATLAKICDLESNELTFISDVNSLKTYNISKHDIVIIDFDDYKDSIDNIALLIKAYGNYPIYGLIDKMDIKIQKKAIDIGFDIIMTKSTFLINIKTIKKQIENNSTEL